ncbi:MAG: hypothetical protein AAFQ22_06710 [Pseudomonadota bacterium]
MDTRSQILRWREIVHPFFWPVFFWNLRRFAVMLTRRLEENDGQGFISYEITWWGGIRVWRTIDPDGPSWDADLERCARCVHLATLDVGNPHLSSGAIFARQGAETIASSFLLRALVISTPYALGLSPAGRGRRTALALGCFAEPAHLNTS